MKITETRIPIRELNKGFDKAKYSGSDENIYCYNGKLNCRPSYQRNFVYTQDKQEKVIDTIFKGEKSKTQFPLSIMYWTKTEDGNYEILDGQQRTLTVLLYLNQSFIWNGKLAAGLDQASKEWLNNYEFTVYICEKDDNQTRAEFEKEILEWFEVINIAGEPLTNQELLNAIYSGSWVADIKKYFSNEHSEIFKEKYGTEKYFKIKPNDMNRQEFLEKIIKWRISELNIKVEEYMSSHRQDLRDNDLIDYFLRVLNWIKNTFTNYDKEILLGQDWGRLYNQYHKNFENLTDEQKERINKTIQEIKNDDDIDKKDGVIEYILSGKDPKFLSFRAFDSSIKKQRYSSQKGICPLCEQEQKINPNKQIKIHYDFKEMEGDHIIPWSKGGKTIYENCCMLCKKHNKFKSNDEIDWLFDYINNLNKQRD